MWDSFLIFIALHPFLSSLLPISLGCLILLIKKAFFVRAVGCLSLSIGLLLGGILHLRWDSFTIHFSELPIVTNYLRTRVLFVGDSITCEGSRPRGFITKIRSVLPLDHQIVCQKGATSLEIADLLEKVSLFSDPAFIIAQSGINDQLNGNSQGQVVGSQALLFGKLRNKFPNAKVLFLPVHPLRLENGVTLEFPYLTPANLPSWWKDSSSFIQDSLLTDGVHLNAHGHTDLALSIINKILTTSPS
jgi:hypothetical protein